MYSLVLLEEGVCYDQCIFLAKLCLSLRCFIPYSKAKFACYSRCFLWRRQCHPTPVLLPGKSHGQRSLVGCRPRGREESDRTERLHFHFSLSCIGEGNGNPLQCSCLENPRERGSLVGRRLWGRTESDTTEAI